jgi:putative methionine-R-sulfoxide reductase with GAF domain
MSVPIYIEDKVIGVLNIDSDLELKKVFLLDYREDSKVLNVARAYSDLVAEWL